MSKHTPGPWKAGSRSVRAPETEDRLGLDIRLYGGNPDDNRANARLIAAAPELLATLRGLHGVMRERHHGRMPEDVQQAYDSAGELLAQFFAA